jgi:4-hydroxybenzoate polyprenyltransferase
MPYRPDQLIAQKKTVNLMPESHRDHQNSAPENGNSANTVLVVNLDGALLRSSMALERFWASKIDCSLLPYDRDVISYIEQWRAAGGNTVLVTASDQSLADEISGHLGLFDEAYGSNEKQDLTDRGKADFLAARFAGDGFAYMGGTASDLIVWEKAAKAITVNAPQTLKNRVEGIAQDVEHLSFRTPSIKPCLQALRAHQWLKNVLVFAPMIAAHQFTFITFSQSVLAFIAFSLIASSAYVLNDLLDLSADRAHPRKRNRPLASGALALGHGALMAPALFLLGFMAALSLGLEFALVMLGYYSITTAYSVYLKRLIIIDVCTLAGLYVMRIAAGGVATNIPLSVWLLAFAMFFFFALAAVKRQTELVDGVATGNPTAQGRGYEAGDLLIFANMATASGYVSVLVLALYLNSPAVLDLYSAPATLWGICLVILYWLSRMIMVAHRGHMHDDPVVFAAKDRTSLICLGLITLFAVGGTVL